MTNPFSIEYRWLRGEYGEAAERLTLAELSILVDGLCATQVDDVLARTVRNSARLSAVRLAEWITANWWRLLWEPKADTYSWRASHRVGNAGHGYVWPDLSFSSDWHSVLISTRPTASWTVEPIRYLNHFDRSITISQFQRGLDEFIGGTIARLSSFPDTKSDLMAAWDEVLAERQSPEVSKVRTLEAAMGYDPDEAPSGLVGALRRQMGEYGPSAVQEVAASSKEQAAVHLQEVCKDANSSGIMVEVPDWDGIYHQFKAAADPVDVPWKRAEKAAQIARETWQLDGPVSTDTLADLFGLKLNDPQGHVPTSKPLFAGVRDCDNPSRFTVSWSSNHPTSRRFALSRLVGDHIDASQEERLLPGTRSATSRQKFQRAFAQAFLCPFDELTQYLGVGMPSIDDVHDAAEHFDVSPLLIETTLVNKGVMDRDALPAWVN